MMKSQLLSIKICWRKLKMEDEWLRSVSKPVAASTGSWEARGVARSWWSRAGRSSRDVTAGVVVGVVS
ncbi:jg26556 [Pararge aegeria aegeria]|uniref:Jg26556 protein n=1 Tax=Pararge aegeria aegeria TaxID=348720 RepID=A0A8S4QQR4_9NEOP|nr:jg26556 [Pararge aegeria aegeria]